MATIGKVIIDLQASSAQFSKEKAKVQGELSSLGSFAKGVKSLNLEARQSGESAVEKLLKGGGALGLASFAMEGLAKASEGVKEAMNGVADGTMTTSEGIGHVIEKGIDAVPVLGTAVKAFRGIEDATQDVTASIAESVGVSHDFADGYIRSAETVKANYEAINKGIEAAAEAERHAKADLLESGLNVVEKEKTAAEEAHRQKIKQLDEQQKKAVAGVAVDTAPRRNIEKNFATARIEENQALQNKITAIDRKATEEREDLARQHELKLSEINAQGDEIRLRAIGADLDAELLAIRTHLHAQEEEIDKAAKEHAKGKSAGEQADIFKGPQDEKDAVFAQSAAAENAARQADAEKKLHDRQSFEDRMGELAAQGEEERLRASGHADEAEILSLHHAYDQQIAELDRSLKEKADKLSQNPAAAAELKQIQDQAAAEKAALAANLAQSIAAKGQDAEKKKYDQAQSLENDLAKSKIETLKTQAEYGDRLAGAQAKQLEAVEAVKEKREALLKILRDEKNLTASQKDDISQQVAALQKAQEVAATRQPTLDLSKKAAAESRRFDFSLGKDPHQGEPLQKLADQGKQSLDLTKQSNFYLQQLYNFGNNPSSNVQLVDF